jgi:type II secretory pathway component PulK
MGRRDASIFIITIWVLTTLSIFALFTARLVTQSALVLSSVEDNEDLHFIVEAGFKKALLVLRSNHYPELFTSLQEQCLDNAKSFKDIPVGKGKVTVSYRGWDWVEGGEKVCYGFVDEESKININTAPQYVLVRLFQLAAGVSASQAQKIATAIVDYRDPDKVSGENMPEDFLYSSSPAAIKNDSFEVIEELRLVSGVTEAIFQAVRPFLTVYGNGTVNINTAPVEVLESLGLSKQLARKIVLFRAGDDKIQGTADDRLEQETYRYEQTVAVALPLTEEEKNQLKELLYSGLVSVNSTCVSIHAEGQLNHRHKGMTLECVYELKGRILYWKESLKNN